MSRSRITIGVLTGVAVVAVAAVPSLASSGKPDTVPPSASSAPAAASSAAAGKVAAAAVAAKAGVKAATTTKKAVAPKTVRSIKLTIPVTTNKVGANVTGYIQVMDTANKVSVPVPDVEVGLEQKRGSKYVEIAGGTTDSNGAYAVAFTSQTNESLRAVLKPATGKPLYGAVVKTSAVAQVTWASRPTMAATKKVKVSYSFRVNPESGKAQLQIANSKTPKAWLKTTAVKVPNNGVVTGYVVFPTAGTWFVRGASVANTSNGAGYTSNITVKVS